MRSLYPNSMPFPDKGNSAAIIMRTKNRPTLLVRALASALQQKHKNWRLYIVNDGGDKEQAEKAIAPYRPAFAERLTLIHHDESLGVGGAFNSAMQQAKEDFIAVHDDDDAWHSDFLRESISFLNQTENQAYAAAICECELVYEEIKEDSINEKWRQPWFFNEKTIAFAEMLHSNHIPPIAMLMRRQAAEHIGLCNPDLPINEDWDYYLRLLQIGDIGKIHKVLAYYHHRLESRDSYGNTVIKNRESAEHYNRLYDNALIREFLKNSPQNLGLLHLMAYYDKKQTEKLHEIMDQNRYYYDKLYEKIKYTGLWGKMRHELTHLYKKLRKKHK